MTVAHCLDLARQLVLKSLRALQYLVQTLFLLSHGDFLSKELGPLSCHLLELLCHLFQLSRVIVVYLRVSEV